MCRHLLMSRYEGVANMFCEFLLFFYLFVVAIFSLLSFIHFHSLQFFRSSQATNIQTGIFISVWFHLFVSIIFCMVFYALRQFHMYLCSWCFRVGVVVFLIIFMCAKLIQARRKRHSHGRLAEIEIEYAIYLLWVNVMRK